MEKPLTIEFNFPLEGSKRSIPVTAIAEFNPVADYYKVHSFNSANPDWTEPSLLHDQYLKKIEEKGEITWVDRDTGRFTLLIDVMGEAIDNKERNSPAS
jgi:hypothetical protein